MSLLNDIHKTNPGPIEKALRDADIARIGQASSTPYVCGRGPNTVTQRNMATQVAPKILVGDMVNDAREGPAE